MNHRPTIILLIGTALLPAFVPTASFAEAQPANRTLVAEGAAAAADQTGSTLFVDTAPLAPRHSKVNHPDVFGMTALHWAANNGQEDMVRVLLQNGANPNLTNNEGMTPLYYAAVDGRTDIVQLLLQRNARTDIKDEDGMTALDWAALGGHTDIVALLTAR